MQIKKAIAYTLATTILVNSAVYAATPFSKLWDKVNDQSMWENVRQNVAVQTWEGVTSWVAPVAVGGVVISWYGLFRPFTRQWLKGDAKAAQLAVKNIELLPKYLNTVYKMDARILIWEHFGIVVVDPKYRKAAEVAEQLKTIIQDPKLAEKIAKVVLSK